MKTYKVTIQFDEDPNKSEREQLGDAIYRAGGAIESFSKFNHQGEVKFPGGFASWTKKEQ